MLITIYDWYALLSLLQSYVCKFYFQFSVINC